MGWLRRYKRMRDGLLSIGTACTNFTGRSTCVTSGRTPDADFTADKWCDGCIARIALGGPAERERRRRVASRA